jgi:hypothetical protein
MPTPFPGRLLQIQAIRRRHAAIPVTEILDDAALVPEVDPEAEAFKRSAREQPVADGARPVSDMYERLGSVAGQFSIGGPDVPSDQ